jgi:hypothetical protein
MLTSAVRRRWVARLIITNDHPLDFVRLSVIIVQVAWLGIVFRLSIKTNMVYRLIRKLGSLAILRVSFE